MPTSNNKTGRVSLVGHGNCPALTRRGQQDPDRFARLALRLSAEINPAYCDAILMGLGEAEAISDEGLIFDAMRHIAAFGHSDNDRWLGSALRHTSELHPLDIVKLIRDRAVATTAATARAAAPPATSQPTSEYGRTVPEPAAVPAATKRRTRIASTLRSQYSAASFPALAPGVLHPPDPLPRPGTPTTGALARPQPQPAPWPDLNTAESGSL
jgi:hypothetical protein